MKKAFFLLCAFAAFQTLQAQSTQISASMSDMAAYSITFKKVSEVNLPGGKVQVNMEATGTIKNIGNQTYVPAVASRISLFLEDGSVKNLQILEEKLSPNDTKVLKLSYSYIKGKPKPQLYLWFIHDIHEFNKGNYGPNDTLIKTSI